MVKNSTFKLIVALVCLTPFFFSCSPKRTEKDLPKYGQHDVVYEAFDDYEVGDTIYHTVPYWSYLNQDSLWINSSDIKGKIWVVDFIFTHCPTVCTPMTQKMKEVNEVFKDQANEVVFITFSIDPKRDTVARLREYIEENEISANNWHFLTGDQEETNQMAFDGFQIYAKEDDKAPGGFAHSPNFVLVDKNLNIRGVYDGINDDERKLLIEDIKILLNAESY